MNGRFQFSLRSLLVATAIAAVLAFLVGRFFMPNWDARAWYAGYGEKPPMWIGGLGTNAVSYSLGVFCRLLWYVAAFAAILSGSMLAVVSLVRAKGG
jgi:hypothetical protein